VETGESEEDVAVVPVAVTLVLVGRSGVGKSTTGKGLAAVTGRPLVEISHFVRRGAAGEGRTPLEHARAAVAAGEHTRFVRSAVEEARCRAMPCIIVGPRLPAELDFIRRELRPTLSVGMLLPDPERRRRLAFRLDNFDPDTQKERDDVEEKWGIARTLANCDSFVSTDADCRSIVAACLREWLRVEPGKSPQK
jgi:adenylate kinase family enzyme